MSGDKPHIWATSVSFDGKAVLLRGPSGAGKSDLALRLIDRGANLISDDRTCVFKSGGDLLTAPPQTIAGLLEVRNIGLMKLPHESDVPAAAIFDLDPEKGRERLPEPSYEHIEDVKLPVFYINAFEDSAVAKVIMTLRALDQNLFVEGTLSP